MCKELGIGFNNNPSNNDISVTGNNVYSPVNETLDSIFNRHQFLLAEYNQSLDTKDTTIPTFFAIPKLHKNPYKFRFIAGARHSSMKKLSQLLHVILCHFRKHFQNYCRKSSSYDGFSKYWSVLNSQEVINVLHKTEYAQNMEFTVADFSTLYTNLPHDLIKNAIT